MIAEDTLLTRTEFREAVFARDKYQCVVCHDDAQDAHHILERRLFPDGGYYLGNGASLCGDCHMKAEETTLDAVYIRALAGITKVILPPYFYPDNVYSKWGDIIQPNGMRLPGELFHDESVQKVLAQGKVLHLYTNRVKYGRTMHLPNSPSRGKDDRVLEDTSNFDGVEVVVTLKMDGENTTMYYDGLHARSVEEYDSHPSHARIKQLHARMGFDIPVGWRVCGENVAAKHSIHYTDLESYFYMFSMWDNKNLCLPWDETKEWAELLGLVMVPEIYRGPYDETAIEKAFAPYKGFHEGFVVRKVDAFFYRDFKTSVAKYVREGHVQTPANWKMLQVVPNLLAKSLE